MTKKLSDKMRLWIHRQHPTTGQDTNQARWQYMLLDLALLVEALVEAVEPEDTETTIRNLRVEQREEKPSNMMQERNSARAKVCALEVECNKLRAETEMWRDECREWQSSTHQLHKELAEAEAERGSWERQCRNAECGLAEAKAEVAKGQDFWAMYQQSARTVGDMFGEVSADAEIGRLVRGMRQHTSLRCIARGYYDSRTHVFAGHTVVRCGVNAVEALRNIQEAGDDET